VVIRDDSQKLSTAMLQYVVLCRRPASLFCDLLEFTGNIANVKPMLVSLLSEEFPFCRVSHRASNHRWATVALLNRAQA
jgi:hypothetical protein